MPAIYHLILLFGKAATIRRLSQVMQAAERCAELAEASAKAAIARAYGFALGAGARR